MNNPSSSAPQKTESKETKTLFPELIPVEPKPSAKCTLSFEDPNLKPIELPMLESTEGFKFIDVRSILPERGVGIYDPGFSCTAYCTSKITSINGKKGLLEYRGHRIEDLIEHCNYLEVCYLLLFGRLPSQRELEKFEKEVFSEMCVHENIRDFFKSFERDSHPMAIMISVIGTLSAFMHMGENSSSEQERITTAIRLIAKVPVLAAYSFRTSRGLPLVNPKAKYGFVENFLRMMFKNPSEKWSMDPRIVSFFQKIMILHADHEQNASTTTVRIASSTLANPYACIAAGLTTLWGSNHGGANEAVLLMLRKIATKDRIPEALDRISKKEFVLYGFGHRIYKSKDPRAELMRQITEEVNGLIGNEEDKKFMDFAFALSDAALQHPYIASRNLHPNVDFYTGITFKTIGIPENMFTVMFAVSRTVGWVTQLNESQSQAVKLGRPRQLFVGETEKKFVPIEEREERDFSVSVPKDCGYFKLPFHQY